jgi:hypothetical protein
MAAVRDVPDMARKKMTVSSRHPLFLESHFRPQKAASKRSKDVFYAMFTRKINNFPWSDPAQRDRPGTKRSKIIDAGFAAQGIDLEKILEVGHCESIIEFVRVGLGVGFVHGTCLPTLDRRNIGWHDMTEHFERMELSLVYRKSSALKPMHRALLENLTQSAKEMLLLPPRT